MDLNKQKENFSRAYVAAVASAVGVAVQTRDDDDDSVDGTFHRRGGGGKRRSPAVDFQLKCSARSRISDGSVRHRLGKKNYDELRDSTYLVPRILIVVLVPDDPVDWIDQTPERLLLRRCGYWVSLKGNTAGAGQHTVTVSLPCVQQLSADGLSDIMKRTGEDAFP